MDFKLPYGLKNDELLTIEDVQSGLACNCICPACKKQLIARKGKMKAHHFAHYNTEDCLSGLETVLHKLSKTIIAECKSFTTPILYFPNTHFEVFEEKVISIESVKLETKVGEFIPDIVIETKGKKLLIEIVVSNPVNWIKHNRIRLENLPTIEIYVKYLLDVLYAKKDYGLNDNLFGTELIKGTKYKRWLHNPKIELIKRNLKDNYAELKPIKSFYMRGMGSYYFVENCPLEKKHWKSGNNKGKSYASIEFDCISCSHCISIENNQVLQAVYCVGYLKLEFRNLLKVIGQSRQ